MSVDIPALTGRILEQVEKIVVGKEEQSRFAYMRRMNALRMEMKKAVHQENFERAAELRDEIRKLEAAHKEEKKESR